MCSRVNLVRNGVEVCSGNFISRNIPWPRTLICLPALADCKRMTEMNIKDSSEGSIEYINGSSFGDDDQVIRMDAGALLHIFTTSDIVQASSC